MTGLFSECYRDLSSSSGGDDMACSCVALGVPHSKSIMTCQFYFQQIVDELSFAIRIFYMYITVRRKAFALKTLMTTAIMKDLLISPPKK